MPKLGVAQFTGIINCEENIAAVSRLAAAAAEAGVKLLGFHELASTIYPPYVENPNLFRLAEPEDGPSVSAAASIARHNELLMVYPFYERDGDRLYNSAMVFGPRGERLAKYRKTSVPASRLLPGASERYYFRAGDLGFPVVETPWGVRVGVIICYDRNLPEPARCAAMNGAELLFVPVTATKLVRPWWELLLRARAVENVMYVAAPSRIGEDRGGAPGVHYFGESLIVDSTGQVIAHASDAREDLVSVELDLDLLRRQRKTWLFFEDRRPELYAALNNPDKLPRLGREPAQKG